MYKTSNANFPLIYGHEYKTLKLNSNISVQTCISNAILYSLILFLQVLIWNITSKFKLFVF